ncbi:acryloyl-CoA reductase [Melissococcus plutonius]|uniref:acrylyl-CoA reductase family protein n=1 Tax=Melissococcus plutonius TaxID=33970 RepID=UPI00065DE447|nr:acryloyl-CoA reductase [Melissococcus plutonius]KMT39126.1 putative acrylyl-CoA reductase AcuI [Melissococcus plutonius]
MESFTAFMVKKIDETIVGQLETISTDQLSSGDVLIQVAYSSVNYKDALATQLNGGVIKNYPMIPGIDASGIVKKSNHPQILVGQKVLVTGYGLGVWHTGGFSERIQVPGDWVIPLPKHLDLKEAMINGTAGFTAALAIDTLEKQGLVDRKDAAIFITGATGGVGSLAIAMLHKLGYTSITGITRKEEAFSILKQLGTTNCLSLASFINQGKKPLAKQAIDFAIDTTGGQITSSLLPQMSYGGSSAICGNTEGNQLDTTILPFILRGIQLLGIDSVNIDRKKRIAIWHRLATDLKIDHFSLYNEITLAQLPDTFASLQAGQHIGRTIICF